MFLFFFLIKKMKEKRNPTNDTKQALFFFFFTLYFPYLKDRMTVSESIYTIFFRFLVAYACREDVRTWCKKLSLMETIFKMVSSFNMQHGLSIAYVLISEKTINQKNKMQNQS